MLRVVHADIFRYTLAVGRAPFHSTKREDIYRKLKAREYSWPELAKCQNEITDDLRDIVSLLLVHEDERPTPDEIVAHPFFTLGHIPLTLDSACTSRVPRWAKVRPPTAATIKRGYTDDWWTLCKASAVGKYGPEAGQTFGAYGARRNKTVARDCQKEIESGKQPSIPFAKETVYLPFPARVQWPFQSTGGLSEITEEKDSSSEGQALVETTGNDRTKGRPVRARRAEVMPTLQENNDPAQESRPVQRMVEKQPTRLRSVRKISNPKVTVATAPAAVPLRVPKETRSSQRTRTARDAAKEKEESQPELPSLRASKISSGTTQKQESTTARPVASQSTRTRTGPRLRALSTEVPATDPTAVLAQLYTFRDNLARALEKKPTYSKRDTQKKLPFVSKWVDYSRKYGVGYVLDGGSVGVLTAANKDYPVTVGFTTNGLHHLRQLSKDPEYLKAIPIQFWAALKKDQGIRRVQISEQRRADDIRLYWQKFCKYMCSELGDENWPETDGERPNFVKFYQRLGNFGIWGFDDGCFQACSAPMASQTYMLTFVSSSTFQTTQSWCSRLMRRTASSYASRLREPQFCRTRTKFRGTL